MRLLVPRVCSSCGVIQGVTSPVYRFSPQGFSRRQLNVGKDDGRLDARGESRVLMIPSALSTTDSVLVRAVGVGEFLLDAMLFAHLSKLTPENSPRCQTLLSQLSRAPRQRARHRKTS